jgi:hypothetical protein
MGGCCYFLRLDDVLCTFLRNYYLSDLHNNSAQQCAAIIYNIQYTARYG